MDFTLSSTGLQNVDANQITSDNTTIFSSLYVSGTNILSSINNIESCIGPSNSSLNITGTTNITFNAGSLASTYIDSSGLNISHTEMTVFPFSYGGYYNVRERFDNLRHVFLDSQDAIIKYDGDHNTVIKINEANILNQADPSKNYPKRIIFKDFLNNVPAYINTSGLNILDVNGNYNNINNKFTQTGNSLLVCGTNTMIDSNNNLNVLKVNSQTIAGITITSGTWFNVANELSNATKSISDTLTPLANVFSAINSIGDYFNSLLSVWAVLNGFINSTGLVLAFALKMDKFTPTIPLSIVPPGAGEGFNKLQLGYNNTLTVDASNKLSINTSGFLTSPASDLGLVANASGQTTVVLKTISQPITCQSSLNVSGVTTLSNNTTINGVLNVGGYINGSGSGLTNLNYNNIYNPPSIPNLNAASTFLSSLNISGFTTLSNNTTINSSLNVSGLTILSNNTTINGTLNISGNSIFNNIVTINSSLNVSGNSTFNNKTILSTLNVSGFTTLSNNTTISSSLNISGFTILSNTTSIFGTLNISGYTNLSNNTTLLSSLNVSGRTTIGTDIYNYSDSVVEMYKNFSIRKIPYTVTSTLHDRIDLKVGLGTASSYFSMEEGYDVNITNNIGNISLNCYNYTANSTIGLIASKTNVSNDLSVSNNLTVTGKITCQNLGQRVPMYFTTSRTVNLNGTNYSCYDIDLRLYTNSILLDGYNIRQFRIRTWLSDVDYQHPNMYQNNYAVFMSDRNGLSIFSLGGPFDNLYFDQANPGFNQFLYRNSFNILMYCSRQGSKKVYCIIEDLL